MTWAQSWVLWGLAAVPALVVAFAVDAAIRRRLLARLGEAGLLARLAASASGARRGVSATLVVATFALLVVALARPQYGGKATVAKRRGSDVVIALDFSKSMLARDLRPSRIERAKLEVGRLLDALTGDRVGLVAFAGEVARYPLTGDYAAARLFWRDLGPADMPIGGTDIGKAIRAGVDLLDGGAGDDARPRARSIVLLTDGEDTGGDAIDAAREAARKGVRVFAVGIGSAAGDLVPEIDADGRPAGWKQHEGQYVMTHLDEAALRALAEATGGDYFSTAPGSFGIDRVAQALERAEKREYEARVVRRHEEAYAFFLLPAFLLLVVDAWIGDRRR